MIGHATCPLWWGHDEWSPTLKLEWGTCESIRPNEPGRVTASHQGCATRFATRREVFLLTAIRAKASKAQDSHPQPALIVLPFAPDRVLPRIDRKLPWLTRSRRVHLAPCVENTCDRKKSDR